MPEKRRNIYKRGSTWWVRFEVAGQEFRRSLRTGNEPLARRRAQQERDKALAVKHFGDDRKTYVEVFTAWSAHIVKQVSPETSKRYGVSLGQLEGYLKPRFLDEIDKMVISEIVRDRTADGVSNATIRRDLSALSSLLIFASGEGWRDEDDNPALSRLKRVKERRDPIVLPEAVDVDYVIQRAPGNLARMIEAARSTGCRQNELVTAERRGFDRDRKSLSVVGKGNKVRVLKLSQQAVACLRSVPVFLGSKWLFWHDQGEPYRNVASRFRELVRSAQESAQREGIEFRPFTFHALRHLFAVNYLKSGGSIYDLQQHLGHTSVKTTELYLAFLTPEEKRAVMYESAQTTAHVQRFEGVEN